MSGVSPAGGLPQRSFDPAARGPLHALRVVDLSRLVAGNIATKVLADAGAEVLKIEPPEGDTLRAWRVEGIETSWKTICRNKFSLCLHLRDPEAIAVVKRLVEGAAIFVESFRPGVLEAMGLAPEVLLAINPALVILRISGWGQDGPYAHKPGFGTLVEGYSGFAAVNGFEDREPVLPPFFMGDTYAGLHGASAAMIALRHAEATGVGQVVDLSLFEPLFAVLEPQMANWRITRRRKPRTGSRSTNTSPRNAYRTSDGGWVCLSASTQGMVSKLLRAIGRAELLDDPRFGTNPARLKHHAELDAIIGDFCGAMTRDECCAFFDRAGVTIGPIMDAQALESDPYVAGRAALIEVPDAEMPGGRLPMSGEVPRLSRTPNILARPAPRLGEHNDAVLTPILGAEEVTRLRAAGILHG
jgi:crotonobetainyl-CoA:carnitine CoA-transferase CaiB-like acyl-CoA transferase